jgi:hypothetical protein
MEWEDKNLNTYITMTKVTKYYLGLTGDKNSVYTNFLPEKLYVISRVYPQD